MEEDYDDRVLVSIATTCRIIESGRSTVYKLMDSGDLESVKLGNRRLIVLQSIHDMVARLRQRSVDAA